MIIRGEVASIVWRKKKKSKIFFFKQKAAYEIYQCDWSSDVCSSDLDRQSKTALGNLARKAHVLDQIDEQDEAGENGHESADADQRSYSNILKECCWRHYQVPCTADRA